MSSQTDIQALVAKNDRLEAESKVDALRMKLLEEENRTLQVLRASDADALKIKILEEKNRSLRVEKQLSTMKTDVHAQVPTGSSNIHLRAEMLSLKIQNAAKDATIAHLHEYVGSIKTHLESMTALTQAIDSKLEGKSDPEENYFRKELTRRVSVTHREKSGEPSSTSPPRLSRGGSQIGRDMFTPLLPTTDLPEYTAPETHKLSPSFTSMDFSRKTTPEPNRPSPAVTSIEFQRDSAFESGRPSLFSTTPMGFLRNTTGLYVPSTRPFSTEGPKNTGSEPLFSSKRSTSVGVPINFASKPLQPSTGLTLAEIPKDTVSEPLKPLTASTPAKFAVAQMTHADFSAKREAEHQAHPETKRQRNSPRPTEFPPRGGVTGRGDSSSNTGLESTQVTGPAKIGKPIESDVKSVTGGTAPVLQTPNVDTTVAYPTPRIRQDILADEDKKSSGVIKGNAPITPGPVQGKARRYKKEFTEYQLASFRMFDYEPALMSDEDETEAKVQTVTEPVPATPRSPAKVVERGYQSPQSTTALSSGPSHSDKITESPKPAELSQKSKKKAARGRGSSSKPRTEEVRPAVGPSDSLATSSILAANSGVSPQSKSLVSKSLLQSHSVQGSSDGSPAKGSEKTTSPVTQAKASSQVPSTTTSSMVATKSSPTTVGFQFPFQSQRSRPGIEFREDFNPYGDEDFEDTPDDGKDEGASPKKLDDNPDGRCVQQQSDKISLKPGSPIDWASQEPGPGPPPFRPAAPKVGSPAPWPKFDKDEAATSARNVSEREAGGGSYKGTTPKYYDTMFKETWRRTAIDGNNDRRVVQVTKEDNTVRFGEVGEAAVDHSSEPGKEGSG